jgi:hypothetical protein
MKKPNFKKINKIYLSRTVPHTFVKRKLGTVRYLLNVCGVSNNRFFTYKIKYKKLAIKLDFVVGINLWYRKYKNLSKEHQSERGL